MTIEYEVIPYRKLWLTIAIITFVTIVAIPTPESLVKIVKEHRIAERMFVEKNIVGKPETFLKLYNKGAIKLSEKDRRKIEELLRGKDEKEKIKIIKEKILSDRKWREKIVKSEAWLDEIAKEAAFKAKIVIALMLTIIILFATEAIPIGAAALIIPLAGYIFKLDGPTASDIAKNFIGDAAFFILGVLALGYIISEVGLHSRIAALILGRVYGFRNVIFVISLTFPIIGSFISAHTLASFLTPVFVSIYFASVRAASKNGVINHDPVLAKMLLLTLTWSLNVGGVGSPAAGARNAIMLQYFEEYGVPMSFAQWLLYGLPLVPILGIFVAIYVLTIFRPRIKDLTPGIKKLKEEVKGRKMSRNEFLVLIIMLVTLSLWIFGEKLEILGLGAAALFAMLAPVLLRIVSWEKMLREIPWDAWFVYIGALGLGSFMKETGAGLWLATEFMNIISKIFEPEGLSLWIFATIMSGFITNFMSDAATVALLGPITLPMGIMSNHPYEPWAVGLATAFASSYAHFLVIGTPNNVIVYALGRYPDSGKRILRASDFVIYGAGIFMISMIITWIFGFILIYNLVGFPEDLLERAIERLE